MSNAVNTVWLKADTAEYQKKMKEAQKSMDEFVGRVGISTKSLSKVAIAAAATTAAMKALKDAFMSSQKNVDDWGRTIESAKSVYSSFLNSLNNGSMSGFLSHINDVVSAARQAYNAMADLEMFNAFNKINTTKAQGEFNKQLGFYRDGMGSEEAVRAAGAAYQNELRTQAELEKNAYFSKINEIAAQRGISGDILGRIMTGPQSQFEQYRKLKMTGSRVEYQTNGQFGGTSAIQVAAPANEQERIAQAIQQMTTEEISNLQALGLQWTNTADQLDAVTEQIDKAVFKKNKPGSTGGGGTGKGDITEKETYVPAIGSIDEMNQKVSELNKAFQAAANDGVRARLSHELDEAKNKLTTMQTLASASVNPNGLQILGGELSPVTLPSVDDSAMQKAQALAKIGELNAEVWQNASNAIGSVGQALAMIEDPTAKVAGLIAQAIATIATTFAASLKGTFTPWDWIAGAAAGTATMISTIAAIKEATAGSYANGGIVPGNSYSGDRLMAHVNSGELILSRSQQNAIASQLQGDGLLGSLRLSATVSGEQIVLTANNNLRRRGRGEMLTTNSRQR